MLRWKLLHGNTRIWTQDCVDLSGTNSKYVLWSQCASLSCISFHRCTRLYQWQSLPKNTIDIALLLCTEVFSKRRKTCTLCREPHASGPCGLSGAVPMVAPGNCVMVRLALLLYHCSENVDFGWWITTFVFQLILWPENNDLLQIMGTVFWKSGTEMRPLIMDLGLQSCAFYCSEVIWMVYYSHFPNPCGEKAQGTKEPWPHCQNSGKQLKCPSTGSSLFSCGFWILNCLYMSCFNLEMTQDWL